MKIGYYFFSILYSIHRVVNYVYCCYSPTNPSVPSCVTCQWGQFNIEHLHCDPSDCYISATSGISKTGYSNENSLSWILKPLRLTIETTCCDNLLTKVFSQGTVQKMYTVDLNTTTTPNSIEYSRFSFPIFFVKRYINIWCLIK